MSPALYEYPVYEFWETRVFVFQWWTFTYITYEYELPVNFTRMSSFCAGRAFIQPV